MTAEFARDPEFKQLTAATEFLGGVYPEALAIVPTAFDEESSEADERLAVAGLGFAEVLLPNSQNEHATYVFKQTPHTIALERIFEAEERGDLPAGSHDNAISYIIAGLFEEAWGDYLPQN
jgi:hypothetical protein